MTESGRGEGIWVRSARHNERRIGTCRWEHGAPKKRYNVAWRLPHGELTEILSAGSRRGEKELCVSDPSLQCAQICRLTRARNHDIYVLISVRAKSFRQAIRAHDMVLRKHDNQ